MESLNNEDPFEKALSEIIEMNSPLENHPLKVAPIITRFLQYATVIATVIVTVLLFILKALMFLQDVRPPHKTQLTTV